MFNLYIVMYAISTMYLTDFSHLISYHYNGRDIPKLLERPKTSTHTIYGRIDMDVNIIKVAETMIELILTLIYVNVHALAGH